MRRRQLLVLALLIAVGVGFTLIGLPEPSNYGNVTIPPLASSALDYLPMTSFLIESTCGTQSPQLVDSYTVTLTVVPYDPLCESMVEHAVSHDSYLLDRFYFSAAFIGRPVAPQSIDELAVFASSDLTGHGGEYGVRLDLRVNELFGYVQDGTNTVTQGKPFFHNIKLMNGDRAWHDFEVKVTSELANGAYNNSFSWVIDGVEKGQYNYLSSTPYVGLSYHVVCVTHRRDAGWDSTGIMLIVGRIRVR